MNSWSTFWIGYAMAEFAAFTVPPKTRWASLILVIFGVAMAAVLDLWGAK